MGTSIKTRDVENQFAVGGMRRPADSIARLGGQHKVIGAALMATLSRRLAHDRELLHACLGQLGHAHATGPTEVQLEGPRFDMKALLPQTSASLTSSPGIGTSIDVELLSSWISAARDPDSEVITWLLEGLPLGIEVPMNANGIFPAVSPQ
eukprot:3336936-Amphidinium_carterae.3